MLSMSGYYKLLRKIIVFNFSNIDNYSTHKHVIACEKATISPLKHTSLKSTSYTHSFY